MKWKIFLIQLIFIFCFYKTTYADSNFETTANFEYKVEETGAVFVTNTFTIKNLKSNYFPKKFTYKLDGVSPQNIQVYETGRKLSINTKVENGITILDVSFSETQVGKDASKTFIVTYESGSLAQKSGEVWEVYIPRINENEIYKDIRAVLSVPDSWGEAAYMFPEPLERKNIDGRNIYVFTKDTLFGNHITAGFGKYQAFEFTINYNLENTTSETKLEQIALPPDTSTQILFYENIDPKPLNVEPDSDGNWLASYRLLKNQKMKVQVKGVAQVFSSPRRIEFISDQPIKNLTFPTTYWQSDDPNIVALAKDLATPEEIFKYVSGNLKYDYGRISKNYERLGAIGALKNPEGALCMEFTDLFIALSRAAGIPAREINGYAYSQNEKQEPLSLVEDILHSWPEYWDDTEKRWVPVDPTWAATSGGTDYFNKFDLKHFAFVIHGTSDVKPFSPGSYKLGSTPEKDVFVKFGKLPEGKSSVVKSNYKERGSIPLFSKNIDFSIINSGKSAAYNIPVIISLNDPSRENININVLPPYGTKIIPVVIPYGLLGLKAPEFVAVNVKGDITQIPTAKIKIILSQLITLLVILVITITLLQLSHKLRWKT